MSREACPNPRVDCKYDRPFADDHHLMWPRDEYTTPTEKKYRALECNILRGICRCIHEQLHQEPPPEKPDREVMLQTVWGHQ